MSRITIHHLHGMTQKKAKARAVRVAKTLEEEFELSSQWQGNTLTFERSGLTGSLVVSEKAIDIEIELGFLLGVMKNRIETELKAQLTQMFGAG